MGLVIYLNSKHYVWAALTAKIDKSNTVKTTSITMQS